MAIAALLAGCSVQGFQVSQADAPATAQWHQYAPRTQALVAMTNARHMAPPPARLLRINSWMNYVPAHTPLLYVSDAGYYPADVDVFDYKSGALVGQATGFSFPENLCSDKSGNVYVADFEAGTTYEIKHASTQVIASWNTGGNPIGCSVSAGGDLAITLFYYGGTAADGAVDVFPSGSQKGKLYSGPGEDWPAGYDSAGHLFVEGSIAGQCTSPCLAELTGSGSWQVLSFNAVIHFPGAVELMGTTLGVGDQNGGGDNLTYIYATKVSGTTATESHAAKLTDTCDKNYVDVIGWANVSKHPNGLQYRKVTGVAGPNLWCDTVEKWRYPAGGKPSARITGAAIPYGATLTE